MYRKNQFFYILLFFLLTSCGSDITYTDIKENLKNKIKNTFTAPGNVTHIIHQNVNSYGVDNFTVELAFLKDDNANNSASLYYCNLTDDGSCDPKLGTKVPMIRSTSKFLVSINSLSSPNDPGDTLRFIIELIDEDGIQGSLTEKSVTLLQNDTTNILAETVTNIAADGFEVTVDFLTKKIYHPKQQSLPYKIKSSNSSIIIS